MMHRFFLSPDTFRGAPSRGVGEGVPQDGAPTAIVLTGEIAHQLRKVLRLRPGARVVALDGSGWEYEVELLDLHGDGATARVCARRPVTAEPRLSLVLYQGMLKGQRFEWVLQKGTELGVSAFVPTETRRTVARSTERWVSKRARWERIIREAAEQSGRGRLPRLADPLSFCDACREAAACELALIPWEGHRDAPSTVSTTGARAAGTNGGRANVGSTNVAVAAASSCRDVLRTLDALPRSIALLIGPEGGFEEEEIILAREHGIRPVTLGPRILRAETAALAGATIILSELGEMA
jgi:16S rRNA (uracil1498-N3)-methyltransferase